MNFAAKIRVSERKVKRILNFSEREYIRRSQLYEKTLQYVTLFKKNKECEISLAL